MTRFLFSVWSFPGHLNPCISIAQALRARGHEVAFYTGRRAQRLVEDEGFKCFPFEKVDEERIYTILTTGFYHFPSLLNQLRSLKQTKAKLQEWLLDTIPPQVEDLEAVIEAWSPDVLVCETSLWAPLLILHETHQLPVAVFSTVAGCMIPGSEVPDWRSGRPKNGFMRMRANMKRRLLWQLSADFRRHVNDLRERYGLSPLEVTVTEFAGQMPLYLMPSIPEFDYERTDLPPSVHYVGPCLWDKPRNAVPPDWVTQLPADQPLILVSESTIHSHEPFLLRAAASALSGLPVQVVMTTGKHRDPTELDLDAQGANVRVERYVPHSDLMPKTSVLITMGGAGTIMSALKAGVPIIIVPTEWDKPANAQRVEDAAVGLRINPKHCTPARLRAAVERVLSEPSFRTNAERLAKSLNDANGPDRAADLLAELATRGNRYRSKLPCEVA